MGGRDGGREVSTELTAREVEILGYVAAGKTNTEIGGLLWLSPETIKSHLRKINVKLSAKSRGHAVAIAFRAGLLQ